MPLEHVVHPIPPLFNAQSEILILGSFPSVKSRETAFFYGHPQNRFWPLIAALTQSPRPQTIAQKKDLILKHHFALWDVIASCDIVGSSDSSIQNVVPNDLSIILAHAPIQCIAVNGKTADRFYKKYAEAKPKRPAIVLPSSSPAIATWSFDRLLNTWARLLIVNAPLSFLCT